VLDCQSDAQWLLLRLVEQRTAKGALVGAPFAYQVIAVIRLSEQPENLLQQAG
jgi:hypothetical protein